MRRSVVLCFFVFRVSSAFANFEAAFEQIQTKMDEAQAKILLEDLALPNLSRPERCPIVGPTFRELAEKMAAVSSALADSKCYEKHANTIRDINRLAKDQGPEALELIPGESGSLVEANSGTNISITNNQYQSVQTNSSLLGGLFEISKDKECVESLKKNGKLSAVAETLARLGTVGLVLPSSVGVLGSSLILASSGALFILDKLIEPPFTWKYTQDRSDFMALTCSFFYLRSELYEGGFFDPVSENPNEKLKAAENFIKTTHAIETELEEAYGKWIKAKKETLAKYLGENQQEEAKAIKIERYFFLERARAFLRSKQASGYTNLDRFAVRDYFLKNLAELKTATKASMAAPELAEKFLSELGRFTDLSEESMLALTKRQWLGRISSFDDFINQILESHFPEISAQVREFDERKDFVPSTTNGRLSQTLTEKYKESKIQLAKMRRSLEIKMRNIQRQKARGSLSSFDEGAQSEYDLRKEYSNIRKVILGEKGWTFVSFLIEDANKSISKYKKSFERWIKTRENAENLAWSCRDAFDLKNEWSKADSAVELVFGFLGANSDLWTSYHPKYRTFLKVPIGQSYVHMLYKAVRSAEAAKAYLDSNETNLVHLTEVMKWSSTFTLNFGKTIVKVKGQKVKRDELDRFLRTECNGKREL